MKMLSMSEMYTCLVIKQGKVGSLFGNEKQGLYIAALMDLYVGKTIQGHKKIESVGDLEGQEHIRDMYDYVKERQGKSVKSIMMSFGGPFAMTTRKNLLDSVTRSFNDKVQDQDTSKMKEDIVKRILTLDTSDVTAVVLGKLVVELKICKDLISKEARRDLKNRLKDVSEFDEEIKAALKALEALAAAGALAGAGVY